MKEYTIYECEICGYKSQAKETVRSCEERGLAPKYPIGCVYGDHSKDAFYHNITFAVAENRCEGHANWGTLWACRDNGSGDSLGEWQCGGNSLRLGKSQANLDQNAPHFKRMIEWLKSQNINITIWDGEKAIQYKDES